jgi:hypothetical protein
MEVRRPDGHLGHPPINLDKPTNFVGDHFALKYTFVSVGTTDLQ